MTALLQSQPMVAEAYEKFQQFNRDERLRILDEAHQQFLHDKATDIEEAHGKGKVEGKAERDIEIARSMKMKGLDFALIAEITGLSSFEIERLN